MSNYEAAWAYLQGALEALTPLVADLSPVKLKERLEETIRVGRGLSSMVQMPTPEAPSNFEVANSPEPIEPTPGSVFFPHDLQRSGNGTFTPPEPTEEEIEELLKRRTGQE